MKMELSPACYDNLCRPTKDCAGFPTLSRPAEAAGSLAERQTTGLTLTVCASVGLGREGALRMYLAMCPCKKAG